MVMKHKDLAISRRTFLAGSVNTGLFLALGSALPGCSSEQTAERVLEQTPKNAVDMARIFSPAVWFEMDANGQTTVNIAKAEMGQHVGTALARIVADELGADWSKVSIKHVDTDPKWGYMVTGGSWSVFTSFAMLSQAGAAGRTVLIDEGAKLMGVAVDDCTASDGHIVGPDQRMAFGDIIQQADITRSFTDEELKAMPIKPASERQFIGKETTAKDIPSKSKGSAVYGLDTTLPGMVYATPMIPPTRYGSSIKSIDDSKATAIPGYQRTLQLSDPSDTVQGWALTIADSFPAAMQAASKIKVEWKAGETVDIGEADIFAAGQALVDDKSSGVLVVNDGDVPQAQADASDSISAVYRTSTALHYTLEPQNALVEFKDNKCHIHSGNQWQSLILPVLSKALDMPETDIIIHQYYLGGGFGRRLYGDSMVPAVLAARELGKPVKLIFPRHEDSLFDCARSPSVARFDASYNSQGELSAVEHAASAGWPTLSMAPGFLADGVDGNGKFDTFSISGADHWYTLPAHRVRAINNDLAQRTFLPGWLRAVGPGWIGWGVESFMDELAHKASTDAIEYRLARLDATGKNAGKAPEAVGGAQRLANVLKDVRTRSGWGKTLPEGEGMGVAIAHGQERTMPTWTACVVHLKVDSGTNKVTVKKIWQSIDCGTVVHPDGAMAQAEGATLWGLSLALFEGTEFASGHVGATNLDQYTPLRMADVPELSIEFMDSTEVPTGLGEPPLIAVAPAIGNAIFAATGKRMRDLPIRM